MDNYKEYLEERMQGMYESYNSVILEEFKKNKNNGKRAEFKTAFINYLVFKYEDNNIRYDFKNAKTDKEKKALINKYSADFAEWQKRQKRLTNIMILDFAGIGASMAGAPTAGMLMAIICWGGLIKEMMNDYKAREDQREADYNKKHKK